MSYRAFRTSTDQLAAEANVPDRFDDGSAWLALASMAEAHGAAEIYSPSEWTAITGLPVSADKETITASGLWRLHNDYESARLATRYVTIEGLSAVQSALDGVSQRLRAATSPGAIRGLRAAAYVLNQATLDPDKRATFIQLARANDALGVALYRRAAAPTVETWRDRLRKLKAGTCTPVTQIEINEWRQRPIPGYRLERYSYPAPGGWHICSGGRRGGGFVAG